MAPPVNKKRRVKPQLIDDVHFRCIKFRYGGEKKLPHFQSKEGLCIQKDATLRLYMSEPRDVAAGKEEPRYIPITINLKNVTSAESSGLSAKGNKYVVTVRVDKVVRSSNKHLLGDIFYFYFTTEAVAEEFVSALECHGVVPCQTSQSGSSPGASPPIANPPHDKSVQETPSPPKRRKTHCQVPSAGNDPVISRETPVTQKDFSRTSSLSPCPSSLTNATDDTIQSRFGSLRFPQAGQVSKHFRSRQTSNRLNHEDLRTMNDEQLLSAFDDDPVIESLRMCLNKVCDNVMVNYIRIHAETKQKEVQQDGKLMMQMAEALRIHRDDISQLHGDTAERAHAIQANAKACDQSYTLFIGPMREMIQKIAKEVMDIEMRNNARQALPQPFPK